MSAVSQPSPGAVKVHLRSVALPPEHGGWGFLLEPILLGLFVAASWGGLAFGLAVIGAFLARQPIKVAVTDRRRGKRYARTQAAERFAVAYSAVAIMGLALALALHNVTILLPVLLAVPLGVAQMAGTVAGRGRDLIPEVAGALALGAAASSIALAGGASTETALALWAVLAARDVPSILYVRERLKLEKGKPYDTAGVAATHALAVIAMLALAAAGLVPWLAAGAALILAGRALWGLSRYRKPSPAKTIGFLEVFYGLLTVALAALGYHLGV